MNDDRFLPSAYKTGIALWTIGAIGLLSLRCWSGLIGWTIGAMVSFGLVRSLEVFVRHNFVPGTTKSKQNLTRFSLVKLPIIVLILIAIVLLGGRDFALVGAFCAGLVLVQASIALTALRSLVAGRPG
jgi:hypothetical protein